MLEVVLLGTGGMMPLPGRWLSSLAVRVDGQITLFDCGEGTQIAWRAAGWTFHRLGAICLSHTHADHVAGLPGLLHAVANSGRTEPLAIFGPVGSAEIVRQLRAIAPILPFAVSTRDLRSGEEFELPGGLYARCAEGDHGLPVLAYRADLRRSPAFLPDRAKALGIPIALWRDLQEGRKIAWNGRTAAPDEVRGPPRPGISIAYVTDTRITPDIAALVMDVDLLVSEATYGSDDDAAKAIRNKHLTFREAAHLARDARAQALWLTHFSPGLDDPAAYAEIATGIFPAAVVGYDGLVQTFRFR